jgi:hypothetical protein
LVSVSTLKVVPLRWGYLCSVGYQWALQLTVVILSSGYFSRGCYLGRVGVDDPLVLLPLGPLDHQLLAVGAEHLVRRHVHAQVHQVEELLDVAQELLGDPLARRVDAALHAGGAEQDRRGEQADADGFAEPGGSEPIKKKSENKIRIYRRVFAPLSVCKHVHHAADHTPPRALAPRAHPLAGVVPDADAAGDAAGGPHHRKKNGAGGALRARHRPTGQKTPRRRPRVGRYHPI